MPIAQDDGLPNIVGSASTTYAVIRRNTSGALANSAMEGGTPASTPNYSYDYSTGIIDFDASLSNEIYGKSDKVLPESFALIAQIKY